MSDAAENQSAKPKKDMGKIMLLAFAGLNLAVLGLGAFLVYSSTLGHKAKATSEEELNKELVEFRSTLQQGPVIYSLDTFNTNLNGIPRRFVRMHVNLEMLDEEGFEEVVGLGAEARDSIVRILNAKKYDDIETVQGKLHLKNQIITEVNGFLKYGVVKNVYFSDFAVQ